MSDDDPQAGFTLIEVLVAFIMATLGIVILYSALASHHRQAVAADLRERTLGEVQAHLDTIGHSVAIRPGISQGTYPNGVRWRLRIAALEGVHPGDDRGAYPVVVMLDAYTAAGREIIQLKTIKLAIMP